MSKGEQKCETQALTCLLGDIFHSTPGSSADTSPRKLLPREASLSRTCLALVPNWKTMEMFTMSHESWSHYYHSILLFIAHTWKQCNCSDNTNHSTFEKRI